jgi:glycine/D-amino acid oxidase-like deaminating enzyme
MDSYNTSFWETQTFLKKSDVIIIGSGIVGLSTAISIKEKNPALEVLIIDRNAYPLGASTRNAGFACFGSVTELLDDLEHADEEKVFSLLMDRVEGLRILKERVGNTIDYSNCGSYELFDDGDDSIATYIDKIQYLNQKIFDYTGLEEVFSVRNTMDFPFSGFSPILIKNRFEGQLHPGKMTMEIMNICKKLGVQFLFGTKVEKIHNENIGAIVECEYFTLQCKKAILCSNGFTGEFFQDLDLKPARNQVIVTERIPDLDWSTCFHYDRGYIYFRNVDKRI